MSNWYAKMEAARKRQERESLKHQRALERSRKEKGKLTELENARMEVEEHETELEVLLSIHKESSERFHWEALLSKFPPHPPARLARNELVALLKPSDPNTPEAVQISIVETAQLRDEEEYKILYATYETEYVLWEKLNSLTKRVISGETKAYSEAATEFSPFSEIAHLGSSIGMTVHDTKIVECRLKVNGRELIPSEAKSLTASGKLSVKAMPKARFHEIYQDYVCGAILRVAREILALLPIDIVLITATVDGIDTKTGRPTELPVLSAVIPRAIVENIDFEHLDPSDSMDNFVHRGDVKTSRKSGEFEPIIPLTIADITLKRPENVGFIALMTHMHQCRAEIARLLKPILADI